MGSFECKTLQQNVVKYKDSDKENQDILLKEPVSLSENVSTNVKKSQEIDQINFFNKPNKNYLDLFFSFHPIQPIPKKTTPVLPFDYRVFYIKHSNCRIFQRNWLGFNSENRKLYCSISLAFGDGISVFCQGFDRYRHLSQTLGEHEKSNSHIEYVNIYITHKQGRTINNRLFEKQLEKRTKEIMERRNVLSSIIDVIKLIGKQGLAFRGTHESAYSLDDPFVNHGNFLEILLLLSNYDQNLAKHIRTVVKKSKAALEEREKSEQKGRGSQIMFISKTTITKIIVIINHAIQNEIAKEVQKAKFFSALMDTTMDVSSSNQCVIVLRYLLEKEVKERVIGLKCVQSTTGEFLFNTFLSVLNDSELKIENCIANAFDGASNMSGEYNGVSSKLKAIILNHVYTCCSAHVLNLVITDTAQCLPESISFFGLLQQTQVFLKESHKRLSIYLLQNPTVCLGAIGATRWRSKSDATTKIFGYSHYWFDIVEDKSASQPVGSNCIRGTYSDTLHYWKFSQFQS